MADDSEKKCLLTPTTLGNCSFIRSENDLPTTSHLPNFTNSPLIYSEPALSDYMFAPDYQAPLAATNSDPALPHILVNDSGISSLDDDELQQLRGGIKRISEAATPKTSTYHLGDSKNSIATVGGSINVMNVRTGHKQSFSTREIREQHEQIQKKYRPARRRHYTDPVDFEGILNIIGGCSWWQIWVYMLISLQQVPHAMFNLSVVYMMFVPDHWCEVPGFANSTYVDAAGQTQHYLWGANDVLNETIVFGRKHNIPRDQVHHDQCEFYNRSMERFEQLRKMPIAEARQVAAEERVRERSCMDGKWQYDRETMKDTIVTEWNLVCNDNIKRAHAQLSYSLGYLVGCLLGGFASDRLIYNKNAKLGPARFGRKPTVIGFGILSSMFGLFLPYSTYFPMFLLIRFFGAVCNEAADLAAYVLCMEITGTKYRAMVGSLIQAPWAVGYAFLALIAYLTRSWRTMQLITAGLHTFAVMLICVLPESPRWLIVNNRVREAERYIRKACRFNNSSLPSDLELVKHAEQRKWVKRDERASVLHLLKSRALLVRTLIIFVVWIATALVYYGLVIAFSDHSAPGRALFSGNFFANNAIAGAIELPTLLGCVYLMKFGRKRAQMVTLIGAGLFIFIAMLALQKSQWLAFAFLLFGKVFIQGAFNILYIFTSELYPTVIRNSAVGASSMIGRLGSGASSYIAILSDVTLPQTPMIIFAVFSLFAGVLVIFLPETQDQPLPDTLQDAVTFLRNDNSYYCYGMSTEKNSLSLGGDDSKASNVGGNAQPSPTANGHEKTPPIGLPSLRNMLAKVPGVTVQPRKARRPLNHIPSDCYHVPTNADSIFEDLAQIQIPEKLPEAFSDDRCDLVT